MRMEKFLQNSFLGGGCPMSDVRCSESVTRHPTSNNTINLVLLFISLTFLSCASLSAQKTETNSSNLIASIPIETHLFTTDKLGQCYVLSTNNEVIKYSPKGKELFRYSNNTLGELSLIDATDPFNILLFYQAFSTIITLDRTLNPTGEFNLYDLDIIEVEAVGVSNDNNIWLYDEGAFKLKKISKQEEIVLESKNLSLLFKDGLQINFITEKNNQVFLNDPTKGILVFDLYGRFLRTINIKALSYFQIIDERLFYQKGKKLFSFHLQTLNHQELILPVTIEKEDQHFFIQKGILYLSSTTGINIYSLKEQKNSSQK